LRSKAGLSVLVLSERPKHELLDARLLAKAQAWRRGDKPDSVVDLEHEHLTTG
jgi:hypothetical protein